MASESGEEVEHVKHLQTDGQTDGQRTKSNQKSSLEHLVLVKTSHNFIKKYSIL